MHIATILKILSMKLADSPAKRKFMEMLKKFLLGRVTHTASDELLEDVQFIKQMHAKHKNPDAVGLMLVSKALGHHTIDHQDFIMESLTRVYREVVKQMYEYFGSSEATNDPMSWRGVYANIFESVMDSKAEQFVQQAAEHHGLNEVPEPEFWSQVTHEIEELTRT